MLYDRLTRDLQQLLGNRQAHALARPAGEENGCCSGSGHVLHGTSGPIVRGLGTKLMLAFRFTVPQDDRRLAHIRINLLFTWDFMARRPHPRGVAK
ncbi:hypothetical protein ACFQ60_18900 [Streptomyces zhihengii]